MVDDEYYFKDFQPHAKNGPLVVEVAKFAMTRRPVAVYTVRKNRAGWSCDCPSPHSHAGNCKHVRMVQDWLHAGRPSPFDGWSKFNEERL